MDKFFQIKGRKIIVDWAVPKDTYETFMHDGNRFQHLIL